MQFRPSASQAALLGTQKVTVKVLFPVSGEPFLGLMGWHLACVVPMRVLTRFPVCSHFTGDILLPKCHGRGCFGVGQGVVCVTCCIL